MKCYGLYQLSGSSIFSHRCIDEVSMVDITSSDVQLPDCLWRIQILLMPLLTLFLSFRRLVVMFTRGIIPLDELIIIL